MVIRTFFPRQSARRLPRIATLGAMMAAVLALAACGSDSVPGASVAPDQLFWKLQLNAHAVTLSMTAPGNTIHLAATPLSPSGKALTTTAPVHYAIIDGDTSIIVDSTGLVTAHSPADAALNVRVVASQTVGGITLTDTATFSVNNVPQPTPQLTTLTVGSPPGDSAKRDCGILQNLVAPYTAMVTVLDEHGTPINNTAIAYRSSNPQIASIDGFGTVTALTPGTVTLYAEANVYGVAKTDSLTFVVTYPLMSGIYVESVTPDGTTTPIATFNQGVQTVGAGAIVVWVNQSKLPVDVIFDNPSAAQAVPTDHPFYFVFAAVYGLDSPNNPNSGGNIASFSSITDQQGLDGIGARVRWFPTPGTYSYHSSLYGTTGTLTVK